MGPARMLRMMNIRAEFMRACISNIYMLCPIIGYNSYFYPHSLATNSIDNGL